MTKITKDMKLIYESRNTKIILVEGRKCFYYEAFGYLDKYQLCEWGGSERALVVSENLEPLMDYLIENNAEIFNQDELK